MGMFKQRKGSSSPENNEASGERQRPLKQLFQKLANKNEERTEAARQERAVADVKPAEKRGIGNLFKPRVQLDDNDGQLTKQEVERAEDKAKQVLERRLGVEVADLVSNLNFNGRKEEINYSVFDGNKLIGEVSIDSRTGRVGIETLVKPEPKQQEVQEREPAGKTAGGRMASSGASRHEASGEWQIIREVTERGARVRVNDSAMARAPKGRGVQNGVVEYGDIVIVNPQGKEVFRETFVSGPHGNGMRADRSSIPVEGIVKYKPNGYKGEMEGLRLQRPFLIHENAGVAGNLGCDGLVRPGAFEDLKKTWNRIPEEKRPEEMTRTYVDASPRQISQDRKAVEATGMKFKDKPEPSFSPLQIADTRGTIPKPGQGQG